MAEGSVSLAAPTSLLCIDTETTGVNARVDRVVSLAMLWLGDDLSVQRRVYQVINPGIPIPAAATAVHGIRDADVVGAPRFNEVASRVRSALASHVVVGYNVRFDVAVLNNEFGRAGLPRLPASTVIDPYLLFCRQHPRTLSAAVFMYLGAKHAGAHNAQEDAVATAAVLQAQLRQLGVSWRDVVESRSLRGGR